MLPRRRMRFRRRRRIQSRLIRTTIKFSFRLERTTWFPTASTVALRSMEAERRAAFDVARKPSAALRRGLPEMKNSERNFCHSAGSVPALAVLTAGLGDVGHRLAGGIRVFV